MAKKGKNRVKPSKPGKVTCLKCRKLFHSLDRVAIRRCSKCKREQERLGAVADHVSSAGGNDIREGLAYADDTSSLFETPAAGGGDAAEADKKKS